MNKIFLYMTHHQGSTGLKKSFKLQGNWQAIPMILRRLDHKLVMLPLQVKVLLMIRNVIWWLDLILKIISNILMSQYGNQQWKNNFSPSKRTRHGNWFPFLPRGSLSNANGSSEPKLMLMVQNWNIRQYYLLRYILKSMVLITQIRLHRLQRWTP